MRTISAKLTFALAFQKLTEQNRARLKEHKHDLGVEPGTTAQPPGLANYNYKRVRS